MPVTKQKDEISIDTILHTISEGQKEWFYTGYDEIYNNSNLNCCCGVEEIGDFPINSGISYAAEKLSKPVKYIKERYKNHLKVEFSTRIDKYPSIITLLTDSQSYTLEAVREYAKESGSKKFKFYNTTSGSTGNALTIILYIP